VSKFSVHFQTYYVLGFLPARRQKYNTVFPVGVRTSPLSPQPWLITSRVRDGQRNHSFHAQQNPSLGFGFLVEKMFFGYLEINLRLQR
jgi:hypothetical protein